MFKCWRGHWADIRTPVGVIGIIAAVFGYFLQGLSERASCRPYIDIFLADPFDNFEVLSRIRIVEQGHLSPKRIWLNRPKYGALVIFGIPNASI